MPLKTLPLGPERAAEFVELSWKLHAHDAHWIPPLRAPLARELDGESPFFVHGELQMLVCERGGEWVGRAAAIADRRLSGIGQIGYFECADDPAVAGRLFRAAEEWLRARGARQMIGPMNGGVHRQHGLLTRGFETDPFLLEPRNPAHYPRLFEAHGFLPVGHWYGYELDRGQAESLASRLRRLVERGGREYSGYRVQPLDTSDPEVVLLRLHELLEDAWRDRVGHVAIDVDELEEVLGGLLPLLGERHLGVVVDHAGKDAALGFLYPDYGREVHALAGDSSAWGRWKRFPQSRRVVVHTFAALPRARNTGAPYLCLEAGVRNALEDGFERFVVAPVGERLRFFRGIAEPTREYGLYGRPLG